MRLKLSHSMRCLNNKTSTKAISELAKIHIAVLVRSTPREYKLLENDLVTPSFVRRGSVAESLYRAPISPGVDVSTDETGCVRCKC